MKYLLACVMVLMLLLPSGAQGQTIIAAAAANPDLSTLLTMVASANLVDMLNTADAELTLFAPTNAAFDALPEAARVALLSDSMLLTRVLTFHIVGGRYPVDDLGMVATLPTLETDTLGGAALGSTLSVTTGEDGSVQINGASLVDADIFASNSVLHTIDTVLLPPDIAELFGLNASEFSVFGTRNPAGVENDRFYGNNAMLTAEDVADFVMPGVASIESVGFGSDGSVFLTVDLVINESGAITSGSLLRVDGLFDSETQSVTRIEGDSTGIIAPKGVQVLDTLGVVAIADLGAADIKLFVLDSEGDTPPVATIALGDGGSVWDIWYDLLNDTLYAAKTNGELAAYDAFSLTLGAGGPDRIIIPTDADGNKISVNLHGIDVDYDNNTVIISDVGDPASPDDGQIFLLIAVSISDGPTPVDARIAGDQTRLGNPVDLIYDGSGIYVAEKANDQLLYFANILSVFGDANISPSIAVPVTKAESVAIYPTRESRVIADMGPMD